jgi:hypothetical protein
MESLISSVIYAMKEIPQSAAAGSFIRVMIKWAAMNTGEKK